MPNKKKDKLSSDIAHKKNKSSKPDPNVQAPRNVLISEGYVQRKKEK